MNIEMYISNLSEDIWDFIQTLSPKDRKQEISENAFLSDREILTLSPKLPSIIVLPHQLDPDFLEYYQALFKNSQVSVWIPQKHTGQICLDLMNDPVLWPKLLELSQKNTLSLKSYSTSAQFLTLTAALRHVGGKVKTPESPKIDDSWTVNFFGSKSGIRQTTDRLRRQTADPESWMATGSISYGASDATALAANHYFKKKGAVIKTNKAHAGVGVEIIPPGKIEASYEAAEKYFVSLFAKERYWTAFPVVVEEFLKIDNSIGGGNPNCEYLITPTGEVKLLYVCGMRVTSAGVFKGIEINQDILPPAIMKRLLTFGQKLGEEYAQAGYRGYFDIDCVSTSDGKLLMTESNVRRTGGTHLYHTSLQLVGPDFMQKTYVFCHNLYELPTTREYAFSDIKTAIEILLFTREKGEGVVIAAANILKQQKLSYIIIGQTKKDAFAIEKKMEKILQAL